MDAMDKMDMVEGKAKKMVKCKLRFSGLILYGKAIRKVNGRVYQLAIDAKTEVDADDLEALKKVEPNLIIVK